MNTETTQAPDPQKELIAAVTQGAAETLSQLRRIIRLRLSTDLTLTAIVCLLEPAAAEMMKDALEQEQETGEPLPKPAEPPPPLEHIKELLLSGLPVEVITTLIAGVVMPGETTAAFETVYSETQEGHHWLNEAMKEKEAA